jgi:lipopolysaccharide transport system ATP-binding protein
LGVSDIAIRAEHIGKRYQIGSIEERTASLPEAIARKLMAPFRRRSEVGEEFWALRDVSFEVPRGQVFGIIGRNGAGKSTLLKVLSRITQPTEGSAEITGRVASLLEVGTGFQPELSGRENIYLNGAILGMRRQEIERKFDQMVAFAGVEKFLDTPVKRYSSGMYLRLAFAVAAHLDPEILIVDEVLAVGDSEFQRKCIGRMGEISKEGRTVLLVSHNLPSVISLCERAVRLHHGKVIAEGPAATVVGDYLNTSSARGGEIDWPNPAEAPGTDTARLHSVRICQDGIDGSTGEVDISKDILVQIRYWNLLEGQPLFSSIWLRDQVGTAVLASANAPSMSLTHDQWYGRSYPVGLFQSEVRIPGNFLNEGSYSIAAIVGTIPNKTLILEDYVISFQVVDSGEMRKEYLGGWIGTVRPRLAWETTQIEHREMSDVYVH